MNYRDFYKRQKTSQPGQKSVSENLESKELLKGMNLEDTSCDDGLPKREDGALDIDHVGQPIHLSKIIQVGGEFGKGPASGEVSGFTAVNKPKGPAPAGTTDSEPIKAGGEVSPDVATKTVGGEVVGGQKQEGPNHKGSINGTPKNPEISGGGEKEEVGAEVGLSLEEAKKALRKAVKEVLKEIVFNKATGKWEKINENHNNSGFPTGGLAMGRPQYKIAGPQFRTLEDRASRSNQYEPEITEVHDDEEDEAMMAERLSELTNARRNLSETELQEMKNLRNKLGEKRFKSGNLSEEIPTPDNSGAAGPQYNVRDGSSQVEVPGKINHARQVQSDPAVNENDEESSFKNGDKVKFTPEYAGQHPDEVFTLSQWDGKKGRVSDKNGRGWYVRKYQITLAKKDKNSPSQDNKSNKSHPKPDKDAIVDGDDAYIFGSDGETILKHWHWNDEGWQQMSINEGRCEDYPCCGHEAGDCPSRDSEGNEVWSCAGCGAKLPKNSKSSLCRRCISRANHLDKEDPTGQDSENYFGGMDETGGQSVQARSFRTLKDLPQNSKTRQADDVE
jgi:hypothetical protein